MKIIKENWKFLFFVLIGSLIGGYCVGLYAYDSFSIELLKQLQEQNITKEMLAISTMLQYGIIFGLVLAIIGIFFSKKANLWKKFEYNKNAFRIINRWNY